MKKVIFALLFLLSTQQIFSQNFPTVTPVIDNVHARYIRTDKTQIGSTYSIPPYPLYRIDGYVFEIVFDITINENSGSIDSVYSVVCTMPDKSVQSFRLMTQNLNFVSDKSAVYAFTAEIKRAGWLNIVLGNNEEMRYEMNPNFYYHGSNRQNIYLEPPKEE